MADETVLGNLMWKLGIKNTISEDINRAEGEIDKLDATTSKAALTTENLSKSFAAAGAAAVGLGASIIYLTDHAKKINAALSVSALQTSMSTEEMRNLALETTNVTFPLSEVQKTFDLLVRSGVRDRESLKQTAIAFDTLGDATGSSASVIAETLIPALNAFDIPLTNAWGHVDTFTHLVRNTTVDLSDFSGMMAYLSADIANMDISLEQSVAVLEAMADRGIQGSAATREFRKAVTAADGDVTKFYSALGLTSDEVRGYTQKLESAKGMTQTFADAANTQYSAVDKLGQAWETLSLQAGSALEPLEGLGAALSASGSLLLGLSGAAIATEKLSGMLGTMSVSAAAAATGSRLLMFALNPATLALAAAGVAALYLYSEYERITTNSLALAAAHSDLARATKLTDDEIQKHIDLLEENAQWYEKLAARGGEYANVLGTEFTGTQDLTESGWIAWQLRSEQATYQNEQATRALNNAYDETTRQLSDLEGQYGTLGDAIDKALDFPETLDDQERAVERAAISMKRAAENLARVQKDSTSTALDLEDAELGVRESVDAWEDAKKKLSEMETTGISEILDGKTLEEAQAQYAALGDQIQGVQTQLADLDDQINNPQTPTAPEIFRAVAAGDFAVMGQTPGDVAFARALSEGAYVAPAAVASAAQAEIPIDQTIEINISVGSADQIVPVMNQTQALADFFKASRIQRGIRS